MISIILHPSSFILLEGRAVAKFWSILFGVVMLACGLSFVVAPFVGWWLPAGVSTHSNSIDNLFYIILYITGFFFFLTEAILVYFMFLYANESGEKNPSRAGGFPAALKPLAGILHDQHRVEMAWTIIPSLILLYIAFAQIETWAVVKYQSRAPRFEGNVTPVQFDVSARQFEWRVRYPHPDRLKNWLDKSKQNDKATRDDFNSFARNPQADDVWLVNEVHVFKDHPALLQLSTRDVIHSFNIPVMRVKQDALPGKTIPVWFTPTTANTALKDGKYVDGIAAGGKEDRSYRWDIPCAELCGWGHYRMIGRVFVHESQQDFMNWLEMAAANSSRTTAER
jgi:cytochrome c oxidase subunit 2